MYCGKPTAWPEGLKSRQVKLPPAKLLGASPAYVNAYMLKGKPYYSVVFAQMPGARKDRHGMSSAAYQNEFNDAMAHNLPTRAVAGIDGAAQQHRFIACWRM